MKFDFENYRGPYVAVPRPVFDDVIGAFEGTETHEDLQRCVEYEPDNHHNAALCPYCNYNKSPEQRYTEAWEAYIDAYGVVRADGDVTCRKCFLTYRAHLQPLKEECPTVRILCDGSVVKL